MKLLLIALLSLLPMLSSASMGKCTSRPGSEAHEKFCSQQNIQTCGTNSAMCTWEKAEIKKMKIIDGDTVKEVTVIEEKVHSCAAKPGNQMHEAFCAKHNKQICATHSHICEWN